jgi:HEAT repeat protein
MGTNAEAAIPALIVYLRSNRARNPSEAAQALALVGHNQHNVVVPVLIESFGASRNYARACAADALGSFGANAISAIPILVSAQNDPDAEARTHVAIAMKQIAPETPDALAPLIQNLVHRESRVRSQALWALSRLGTNGVEALPALAGCLHDQVAQLRVEAEQCVQGVGLLDDEIVAGLKENLTNANHFVSAGAVSALGKFAGGSREAFMALIGGMNSRETEVTQQSKYQLIDAARISPNYLVVALEDSDPMVRYRALSILYDIARPVPESVPALVKLVQDTNAYVSSLAADVLWFQDRDAAKRLGIKHP